MLHKTKGVVLRYTRYGETSIIVNIFTESFGLQSYIVNGVRSKSGKNKIALYQPLTLLDLVVYHKENAAIVRIKEIACSYQYQHLQSDPKKSCIGLFISELLNKTVKEQSHASDLCNFIIESLMQLDLLVRAENFHLVFLIKLSKYLGFGPFTKADLGAWGLNATDEEVLDLLLECNYGSTIEMSNEQRRNLLDILLRFYNSHVDGMGNMKSIQVLREVLS